MVALSGVAEHRERRVEVAVFTPPVFLELQVGVIDGANMSAANSQPPNRSIRWSPTRMALATTVRVGFTAATDGKKLVSTT